MSRVFIRKPVSSGFIERLTFWISQQESGFCFLGNGWGSNSTKDFHCLAGWGVYRNCDEASKYSSFIDQTDDFVFAAIPYDFKNQLEDLQSNNLDNIKFEHPVICIPQFIIRTSKDSIEIGYRSDVYDENDAHAEFENILAMKPNRIGFSSNSQKPNARLSKEDYLSTISDCKEQIQLGNIYQSNICQEFFWDQADLSPAEVFCKGFEANPNPFSVYFKHQKTHCISWSPERFVSIQGETISSQPMKGTAPRHVQPEIDRQNKSMLSHSEKDRRENVMIVDMVRNDLSLFAKPNSVKVPELYKIETYPKVHQMHSTVIAKLKQDTLLFDAITAAFPMASMTGAPKIRSMEVIEKLERTKRGLFSGSIGFITPNKDADFNVIIRSLIYREDSQYLSCHVGGGITDLSDPELEYEECMTKISPILELLNTMKA